jgi:tRNA-specific 2-thiouridylase
MYVTHIDPVAATVTIGPREQTLRTHLTARRANWHADVPAEFDATVRIRYNHAGAAARVRITGPSAFTVEFAEPVAAITPGQAAVAYDGDTLLGGGWIE